VIKQILATILVSIATVSLASAQTLCPDGSYVSNGPCQLCPDGSYIAGGDACVLTPKGDYVPERPDGPRLAPDGTYVPGGAPTILCPDGSYVSGTRCVLAPDGSYLGE
jgi:hypothetical protein